MASLLIVAHTPLASALAQVAAHTYPECAPQLHTLDVPPGLDADEVRRRLGDAVAALPGEVLILSDVFGATPCNAAREVAREHGDRVRVAAGVNVPMLWRTLCYRDLGLNELLARSLAGATQGVMHVAASSAPSQGPLLRETERDDPKRRHDQQ